MPDATATPGAIAAAVAAAQPGVAGVDRLAYVPWDGSEAGRLAKRTVSLPAESNVSGLLGIDTGRHVAVWHATSGLEPASDSGQRDIWVLTDTAGQGLRHAVVPFWGSPTLGSSDIGNISPQHGVALRYQESGGRRRAVVIWQNITFGVYWSVLVGVWASDLDGANFVNRQVGLQIGALASGNVAVTASSRSGGVVTLTVAGAASKFAAGSYLSVDLATASFDGWFLIDSVEGDTVTYTQAGADESGGTGTVNNILPYDLEVRLPGGSIAEVRAKRRADAAWPAWAPYDTDAGAVLSGSAGNYVSMPDDPDLDLTGTITLVTDVTAISWTPGLHMSLLSKFTTTNPSGQRSYRSRINNTGRISFGWSTAGTSGVTMDTTTALSAQANNTRRAVAVEFVPNDGAGNRRLRVYTAPTHKDTWVLHEEVVTAGATTIFQGTAPLELGAVNNGALELFTGRFHYAAVIDGTLASGVVKAEFMPMDAIDAVTTWNDPTSGNTWTLNGGATIENTGIPATDPRAFAVDLDMAGASTYRVADPAPLDDDGQVGFVVAHLGTDARSQVSYGPSLASSSLADLAVPDATVTPDTIAVAVAAPAAAPAVVAAPAAATVLAAFPASTQTGDAVATPAAAAAAVSSPPVSVAVALTPGPVLATLTADTAGLAISTIPGPLGLDAGFGAPGVLFDFTAAPAPFGAPATFGAATATGGTTVPAAPTGITADDLAEVREWVGAEPADDIVEAAWARKGTVVATALAILRARRADILAGPTRWAVGSDYSQEHTAEAIKALNAQIDQLETLDPDDKGGGYGMSVSYLERCGTGR
jgi:hypothetical protein